VITHDKFAPRQPGSFANILRSISIDAVGLIIPLSFWKALGTPFVSADSLWSLGNVCLTLLFFFYLSLFFNTLRLLLVLAGYEPIVCMRDPLFLSTCPSDFWGRRWNIYIHTVLKRSLFATAFGKTHVKGLGKTAQALFGSFLAFFVSAIAHEYFATSLFYASGSYHQGSMFLFFILQFPMCTAEKIGYRMLPESAKHLLSTVPQPAKLLVSYALMLPLAPLFHMSFQEAFSNMDVKVPVISWG